jgi:DNA-binding NarL/FixJ family response regulator
VSRVVILAEHRLLAELMADALSRAGGLEVTVMGHDPGAGGEPQAAEAWAGAVLVCVPDRPLETAPWPASPSGAPPTVVIVDPLGQVGLERALRLGAHGYVGPRESRAVLVQRVRQAAEGAIGLTLDVLAELQATTRQLVVHELRLRGLTGAEIQLLQWLAHHDTAKEIAARLKIRVSAAQSRIRRVREKLESRGEGESQILALLAGLYGGEGGREPAGAGEQRGGAGER